MFPGWPNTPAAKRDGARRTLLKHRLKQLRFDKPVLQVQFPKCLAVDPWTSRKLLAVAEATITVVDVETDVAQSKPLGEQQVVVDAAWYPFDSELFVTGTVDRVSLWDTSRLVAKRSIQLSTRCNQLAFSPSPALATTLAIATSHGEVRLADLRATAAAHTLVSRADADLTCLAWSPRDIHVLVSGGADARVLVWDVRKPSGFLASLDEHSSEHSARSHWFMENQHHQQQHRLGSNRTTTTTTTTTRGSRNATAHGRSAVTGVAFLEDGKHVISTASNGSTNLWREGCSPQVYFNTHVSFERKVAGQWGALGQHLALARRLDVIFTSSPTSDNVIDCSDALTGKALTCLSAHVRKVRCLAFREEGDVELFSAAEDGFVLKWTCPRETDQVVDEDDWTV